MDEKKYRLDKTVFKAMSVEEADDHVTYWNDNTESERLNAACFIINQIFGVTPKTEIDFTITDKRKRD
jgi:hypothetical protein